MMASDSDFSVSLTPGLEAETERLLAGRTREIRFSAEMVRAYRHKTWPQRSKIVRAWMVWVGLVCMLYVPISYLLAPQALLETVLISGVLIPALHACVYWIWLRPRSAAAEGLSLILLMLCINIGYGWLALQSGRSDERIVTGVVFVNAIAIGTFNIDYLWSLGMMAFSITIFYGFEMVNPLLFYQEAVGTSIFYMIAVYSATIARKTQLILSQKNFLLSLRDRYRSEALNRANQQLEILATRDPLTGLANRRSAADLMDRLWNDRRIPRSSVAFVMADIDSFKRLNDSAGHAAGDDCIRRVAATIEQTVRVADDAVFRYGGEEFLIVLTNATPDLAFAMAERIRCAVEALGIVNPGLAHVANRKGVVTISLGIAFASDDATPERVAKWADEALYDAKHSGRNAVFLAAPSAGAADSADAGEPPDNSSDASAGNARMRA
jgi:diguanylate cyclase (GGDEF)-like protein